MTSVASTSDHISGHAISCSRVFWLKNNRFLCRSKHSLLVDCELLPKQPLTLLPISTVRCITVTTGKQNIRLVIFWQVKIHSGKCFLRPTCPCYIQFFLYSVFVFCLLIWVVTGNSSGLLLDLSWYKGVLYLCGKLGSRATTVTARIPGYIVLVRTSWPETAYEFFHWSLLQYMCRFLNLTWSMHSGLQGRCQGQIVVYLQLLATVAI